MSGVQLDDQGSPKGVSDAVLENISKAILASKSKKDEAPEAEDSEEEAVDEDGDE